MPFERTLSGKRAKYHFYKHVLVWVEGPTDVVVFEPVLRDLSCRLEPAGCRDECLKLAEDVVRDNAPVVVIMDGEYRILRKTRAPHRRVIYLQRHSIENYFFEEELLESICRSYVSQSGVDGARPEDDEAIVADQFLSALSTVNNDLYEALILDVANFLANAGLQVLPDRIESILQPEGVAVQAERLHKLCEERTKQLPEDAVRKAQKLITTYAANGRLANVLKGHLAFGILRRIVFACIKERIGKKPQMDDGALRALIAGQLWDILRHAQHHSRLKAKLRKAVRDAASLKAT